MSKILLEIASFSVDSALLAIRNGADRLELCEDSSVGGLSPTLSAFESVLAVASPSNVPVFVMIRNRPGDFYYSGTEISDMCHQIRVFREHGADGFVFGCLKKSPETGEVFIDAENTGKLLSEAKGFPCTFHRAFDEISDKLAALMALSALGVSRILTSGGEGNAMKNVDVLASLTSICLQRSLKVAVIAGGGVRCGDLKRLLSESGVKEVHSSAIVDGGETADPEEVKALKALCTTL